MSLRELIASIVGDLAWPVVLVVLALLFRQRVAELLGRITGWEGFGQKISFSEKLADTEAKAEELRPAAGPAAGVAADDAGRALADSSQENPSYVVLSSWERVLAAASDLIGAWSQAGVAGPRSTSQGETLNWIRKHRAASEGVQETLNSLRQLRNSVAHGQHRPVPGEAVTYAEIASEVIDILHDAALAGPPPRG